MEGVTWGKPGVDSMASEVEHCSREIRVWLTYAISSNVAVCLKTGADLYEMSMGYTASMYRVTF